MTTLENKMVSRIRPRGVVLTLGARDIRQANTAEIENCHGKQAHLGENSPLPLFPCDLR